MNKRTAFTLIELLIVVAIIAILAAIAVPNFLEAQTRSKISRAKSDERSIATAIEAYVVDYNKLPRDGNDPGITVITFTQETGIPGDAVEGNGAIGGHHTYLTPLGPFCRAFSSGDRH